MYKLLISDSILGLFVQILPISILVALIYSACRICSLRRRDKPVYLKVEIVHFAFVCYITGLVNLTLVPNNFWTYIWFFIYNGFEGCSIGPLFTFEINLVPTLLKCIAGQYSIGSWVRKMLISNLMMLIPMGYFLPLVSQRVTTRNITKVAILIPTVMETIQPVVGRSFDVDDLICNFCGIMIGYCFYCLVAVANANSTCVFWSYQPDLPKELA